MSIDNFDFDDLPENDFPEKEKLVNITIKVSENTRNMFSKISHRERQNMSNLGAIVIEKWMTNYINDYKKTKPE